MPSTCTRGNSSDNFKRGGSHIWVSFTTSSFNSYRHASTTPISAACCSCSSQMRQSALTGNASGCSRSQVLRFPSACRETRTAPHQRRGSFFWACLEDLRRFLQQHGHSCSRFSGSGCSKTYRRISSPSSNLQASVSRTRNSIPYIGTFHSRRPATSGSALSFHSLETPLQLRPWTHDIESGKGISPPNPMPLPMPKALQAFHPNSANSAGSRNKVLSLLISPLTIHASFSQYQPH